MLAPIEVHKAYKVQLYPNAQQEELLRKQIGCNRFVHNQMLAACQKLRDTGNLVPSPYELVKSLAKNKEKYPFLCEVDSDALQKAALDLGAAYTNFFKSLAGKRKGPKMEAPRFKKHSNGGSFRIENKNRVSLKNNTLTAGKHKAIRFRGTAPPKQCPPRSIAVSLEPTGKWFASISVIEKIKSLPKTGVDVGIDPGLTTLATIVTSNGKKQHYNPAGKKQLKILANRIDRLNMWRSRKDRDSSRYKSLSKKIAKLWYKVRCIRSNMMHLLTKRLVQKFDRTHIENTGVKNMSRKGGGRKRGLNRSILNTAIGMMKSQLTYKAKWYQKQAVLVSARNTSKTCNECGVVFKGLTLSMRKWRCVDCGSVHDRDLNAARNILALGYLQV